MSESDRFYAHLARIWNARPRSWRPQLGDVLQPTVVMDDASQIHVPPITDFFGARSNEGALAGEHCVNVLGSNRRALMLLEIRVSAQPVQIGVTDAATVLAGITGPTTVNGGAVQVADAADVLNVTQDATLTRGTAPPANLPAFLSGYRLTDITQHYDLGIIVLPGEGFYVYHTTAATALEIQILWAEYPVVSTASQASQET